MSAPAHRRSLSSVPSPRAAAVVYRPSLAHEPIGLVGTIRSADALAYTTDVPAIGRRDAPHSDPAGPTSP